ncbi:GMC oxidoreductase [Agromyces sp. MMS24-K17]|uniref:GMC oxidoreductase n=1 Tax=Agromyces sp. MMS24-K17 TaxID=3372850 RepID=UPI0037547DD8
MSADTPLRAGALAEPDERGTLSADIVIIGSGMGGGTLAWALRDSGLDVLLVERGGFLPREPQNGDPREMFLRGRYRTSPSWTDAATGRPFQPGVYSWVGGNTKFYGACLPRFRAEDFGELAHHDGVSPAWAFGYDELEPHYVTAERLYEVHGALGEDPTEPRHSAGYPRPPLAHEPVVERLAQSLRSQGLHPFHMANGMNLDTQAERVADTASDGCPSESGAKSDTENRAIRPALEHENVRLLVDTEVTRLVTGADGTRVVAAEARRHGRALRLEAKQFVVAAGAVNSAALLLRSAADRHPDGLANSSGLVGRNYMVHNSTFFMGVGPGRNDTAWQKTLGMNDWYLAGPDTPFPLGNLQMLGKLHAAHVKKAKPWVPDWMLTMITDRSIDLYLTTEDLPDPDNRITVDGDRITVHWKPNNLAPHREFVRRMSRAVRRAGYPLILTRRMGIETNSHQCGTAVAGHDPATSVLDATCRSHDVGNLWLVDSSGFASSAALNPALTIAANAIRVAPHLAAAAGGTRAGASATDLQGES